LGLFFDFTERSCLQSLWVPIRLNNPTPHFLTPWRSIVEPFFPPTPDDSQTCPFAAPPTALRLTSARDPSPSLFVSPIRFFFPPKFVIVSPSIILRQTPPHTPLLRQTPPPRSTNSFFLSAYLPPPSSASSTMQPIHCTTRYDHEWFGCFPLLSSQCIQTFLPFPFFFPFQLDTTPPLCILDRYCSSVMGIFFGPTYTVLFLFCPACRIFKVVRIRHGHATCCRHSPPFQTAVLFCHSFHNFQPHEPIFLRSFSSFLRPLSFFFGPLFFCEIPYRILSLARVCVIFLSPSTSRRTRLLYISQECVMIMLRFAEDIVGPFLWCRFLLTWKLTCFFFWSISYPACITFFPVLFWLGFWNLHSGTCVFLFRPLA